MKPTKRIISAALALLLFSLSLAGCSSPSEPEYVAPTIPENYQWASYNASQDAPFEVKDIFSEDMFIPGLIAGEVNSCYVEVTDRTDVGAFFFKVDYGKCYEIKIPAGTERAYVAKTNEDPQQTPVGEKFYLQDASYDSENLTEEASFLFVCRAQNQSLLIYTGTKDPVYIGERTLLQDTDVDDNWYYPEPVGDIKGGEGSWGDADWSSEEFINNLYEPVRQRHPDYITREVIGKDQSGQYDMYAYVYAPEDYETTLFLVSGLHGDEQTAYFALAKDMQLIADAEPEDNLLFTLRHKVRFVVIPVVNVWSASNEHTRQNSTGMDLNRDFETLTQQESKNIIAYFEKFAEETACFMDMHISDKTGISLWFNFINESNSVAASYKTTNHIYHRYVELGHALQYTDMAKIPGVYRERSNKYLYNRIWSSYQVPAMVLEYSVMKMFPSGRSSEGMTLAVETQMNFIIQNALYFMANP